MQSQRRQSRTLAAGAAFAGIAFAALVGVAGFLAFRGMSSQVAVVPQAPTDPLATSMAAMQGGKTDAKVSPIDNPSSRKLTENKHLATAENTDAIPNKVLSEYQDVLTCREYLHTRNAASSKSLSDAGNGMPSSALANTLESLEHAQHDLEQNRERCAGVTKAGLDKKMFDLSLLLGMKGYQPAQACFVEGPFIELADYYHENPAIRTLYRENAPVFIGNLLAAGDWPTTLRALSMIGNNFGDSLGEDHWLTELEPPDPYLVYRSVRLAYYRYLPDRRALLERILRDLEDKYRFASKSMKDADDWAQQIYSQNFEGLPPLMAGEPVSACR